MVDEKITHGSDGELVITTPLLAELQGIRGLLSDGFARMSTKLEGKADKADMARLEARLDQHATDIAELKTRRHDEELERVVEGRFATQVLTRRQKVWGSIGVCGLIISPLVGQVLSHFINFR
jgi:hypothetical protein